MMEHTARFHHRTLVGYADGFCAAATAARRAPAPVRLAR